MLNVSKTTLMRSCDKNMTEKIGIPDAVLMENAANAVHDEEVIKTGHSGQGGRKFLPIRAGGRDIPHHQNTWRQRDSL